MTNTTTPEQIAFTRRHGFRQDPATGTFEATLAWSGKPVDIRVKVLADAGVWSVGVEDVSDARANLYTFSDAKKAWTFAIRKTQRIVAHSGRELRTFGWRASPAPATVTP
jgi:hypothetical protein